MNVWYYVDGTDKVGPIEEDEVINLCKSGILTEQSYIWRKGFDNWIFIKEVEEFSFLFNGGDADAAMAEQPEEMPDFVYPTME